MGVFEKNFEFVGHSQYSSNFAHKNGFFFSFFSYNNNKLILELEIMMTTERSDNELKIHISSSAQRNCIKVSTFLAHINGSFWDPI